MFDLLDYARRHRYRTRNLHDGGPVPPARLRQKSDRQAFAGQDDRDDAIICKYGYVTAEGNGLGWTLLAGSVGRFNRRLERLTRIQGLGVHQSGDTEAAGTAPVESIAQVLAMLEPYKRNSPQTGRSAEEMRRLVRRQTLAETRASRAESTNGPQVGGRCQLNQKPGLFKPMSPVFQPRTPELVAKESH